MSPDRVSTQLRRAWSATPGVVRWNGGTLLLVGVVTAAVHVLSNGPSASRADLAPAAPAVENLAPLTHVKLFSTAPATQPAARNLFSLDWHPGTTNPTTQAAVPEDPGFWNDVASPLKAKHTGGGAR